MSSNPVSSLPARKSFAQVAAEAHVTKTLKKPVIPAVPNITSHLLTTASKTNHQQVVREPESSGSNCDADRASMEQLENLLKAAALQEHATHTLSSDVYLRKESSDTKSVASRTTLTLDEKESIQPDDSASMQAAPEEDSLSVSGSGLAMSSRESDPDVRAFREQLQEIDQTGVAGPLTQAISANAGVPVVALGNPEIFFAGPLAASNGANANLSLVMASSQPRAPLPGLIIPPDEKLLEALASPKDRLFVLKIEQDMIDFVKDSKEEFLQLPQTNAFYRMLSHKLADYYLLGHLVDESLTSVRIHRTPHCRLPPPLIGSDTNGIGGTPPPTIAARKIMRRGAGASGRGTNRRNTITPNGQNSDNASGSDDDNKMSDKDKAALSREERENRYNEARARIFKDFKEQSEESVESSEVKEVDVSRSSSASGAKKGKKNRRPKDDGFEARSAYSQYGGLPYTTNVYPQAIPNGAHLDGVNGYPGSGHYPAATPNFEPSFASNIGDQQYMQPQMSSIQGSWSSQPYQTGFVPAQGVINPDAYTRGFSGNSVSSYQPWPTATNMQSQATPRPSNPHLAGYDPTYQPQVDSMWPQSGYYGAYGGTNQSYLDNVNPQIMQSQGQQMYPFSGASYTNFPHSETQYYDAQMAAGSHDQQMFNPQSQSFVPKPRMNPYQQMPHDPNGTVHGNGMMYQNFMPAQRHASNTPHFSQMAGYNAPHYPQPPPTSTGHLQGQNSNMPIAQAPRQQQHHQTSQTSQSTIAKWGTPATLPAKPPPPAISISFQVTKDPQQPLPPHPFHGLGRTPANGTR